MTKSISRVSALIAATAVLLVNGVIYAWSIYSLPFSAGFGWSSSQLGLCFTVMLACFCLGGLLGGVLTAAGGVRVSIPAGAVMGAAGFFLCVFLTADRLWLLYIAFAVSGLGVGTVYNAVLSAVVPRFPDKKGLASGVMMMGFGASSLVLGTLAGKLINSPAVGWHLTYVITGALLLLAGVVGAICLTPPKEAPSAAPAREEGLKTGEMLRTGRFWLFFCIAMVSSGLGSGVIGHALYIAAEAGAGAGLATLSVGLISVCNGLGRIVFGAVHDRAGFRGSLAAQTLLAIAAGAGVLLFLSLGSAAGAVASLMLCGLAYGGVPPISSAVAGEFFGRRYYGKNFSVVNLSILPASFASTLVGCVQTATGSYASAILPLVALEAVAAALVPVLSRRVK